MKYFFLAFHAFPGFSGIEFCAFQETAESWKAGNHSWLSALFCTYGKARKAWSISSWLSRLSQAFGSNIPGFPGDSGILESLESAESLGFPRFPGFPGKRGKPRVSALSWKAKRLLAFLAFPYVQKSVESQEFFRGIPGISWLFFAGVVSSKGLTAADKL